MKKSAKIVLAQCSYVFTELINMNVTETGERKPLWQVTDQKLTVYSLTSSLLAFLIFVL